MKKRNVWDHDVILEFEENVKNLLKQKDFLKKDPKQIIKEIDNCYGEFAGSYSRDDQYLEAYRLIFGKPFPLGPYYNGTDEEMYAEIEESIRTGKPFEIEPPPKSGPGWVNVY